MNVRPGLSFIWGKDPKTARALLAACDELGIDQHVVATAANGFIAPDEVIELAMDKMTDDDDEAEQF